MALGLSRVARRYYHPAMVLDLGTRCAAAVATDFGRDLKVGRE